MTFLMWVARLWAASRSGVLVAVLFLIAAPVDLFDGHITAAFAQSTKQTEIPRLRPHDGPRISNRPVEGPQSPEEYVRSHRGLNQARLAVKNAEQGVIDAAITGSNEQRLAAVAQLELARRSLEFWIIEAAKEMSVAAKERTERYESTRIGTIMNRRPGPELTAELERMRVNFERSLAPEVGQLRKGIDAANVRDAAAQQAGTAPTPIGLGPIPGNTTLNASGTLASVLLPQQSYLGSFDPVSGQERVGLFQTNRRVTMTGGSFSFEQNFGAPAMAGSPAAMTGPFFAYGAFQAAQGSASGGGTFDPGAGNRTLLPGPDGGASGVSLGGHPANKVTGINYHNEYDSAGGMVGLGYRFPVSPFVRVSAGGHIGFHRVEIEQHFAGAITAFARDFAYDTSITTNIVTFGAKGQVDWMVLPSLRTFVKGHAGVGRVKGEGNDTFTFTGLPTSSVNLSASQSQVVGGVSAGFEFLLAAAPTHAVSLGAEVGFERVPGFASVVRDGTNPSQLHLTGANAISGKAKLGVLF